MFDQKTRSLALCGVVALGVGGLPAAATDSLPIPPEVTIPIDECGTLRYGIDGFDCWFFETHNGRVYTIEVTDDFEDGDTVCVSGDLVSHLCATTCGQVAGCIFDNTITEGFVGCGP